jgi:hypothetical protein
VARSRSLRGTVSSDAGPPSNDVDAERQDGQRGAREVGDRELSDLDLLDQDRPQRLVDLPSQRGDHLEALRLQCGEIPLCDARERMVLSVAICNGVNRAAAAEASEAYMVDGGFLVPVGSVDALLFATKGVDGLKFTTYLWTDPTNWTSVSCPRKRASRLSRSAGPLDSRFHGNDTLSSSTPPCSAPLSSVSRAD